MMVTAWLFFIAAILVMFRYLVSWADISDFNKKASLFMQKRIKPVETVKFWIAFFVFAMLAGIIFGGGF